MTACRVVTTRHESLLSHSKSCREKGVDGSWRSETSRQVGAGRDDPRRLVTNRPSCEVTMHASDGSNTNKQVKKVCKYSSF